MKTHFVQVSKLFHGQHGEGAGKLYNESMPPGVQIPIDEVRRIATSELDPVRRASYGQFMTPSRIARFMASLFRPLPKDIKLLDPGAGVGSLAEAFSERFLSEAKVGAQLHISAFEIEPILLRYLAERLETLVERGRQSGRLVKAQTLQKDFIDEGASTLSFGNAGYTHAILNPPYKKIGSDSYYRKLLHGVGVDVGNLYAAFLALAIALSKEGGEVVAIVPRSFCNGTYFRPFREWLLKRVALTHIHVFESRNKAFQDDDVLQENIILHVVRGAPQGDVIISQSHDANFSDFSERRVPFSDVVKTDAPESFIHIPTVDVSRENRLFRNALSDLGIGVSTGPVVDFRMRDYLVPNPQDGDGTVPLLYPHHFNGGGMMWPRVHKKPNAIQDVMPTRKWLMPSGWYTITKRFSAKEERRRIVAYVVDPRQLQCDYYGFENHLNVIHAGKRGLDEKLARGLAVFLNSTMVDEHFRTFSGHTQVNATDLRVMKFPEREVLMAFGSWAMKKKEITQKMIDDYIWQHDC